MTSELKPQTSTINGRLWGTRARDWADLQEGVSQPIYEATFQRTGVRSGIRYLDVGCGAGMAAQIASVLGAQVAGIDASEALLAIARERTPGGDFRIGEIEALPFGDRSFDLVTGFNSLQYAGNPGVALAETRRVAKPDGQVVVATWGEPDGMPAASVITSLRPLLPPPPPGAPGPFALSDEAALRKFAEDAGLHPMAVFDVDSAFHYRDLNTGVRALNSTGVAVRAIENSSEDAVSRAHREAIAPFRRTDGSYLIAAKFRCLLARP
jgi:ubiquinone/menaquinone biosynthesis C-methylase UbiE